jgi:hypothetical protein
VGWLLAHDLVARPGPTGVLAHGQAYGTLTAWSPRPGAVRWRDWPRLTGEQGVAGEVAWAPERQGQPAWQWGGGGGSPESHVDGEGGAEAVARGCSEAAREFRWLAVMSWRCYSWRRGRGRWGTSRPGKRRRRRFTWRGGVVGGGTSHDSDVAVALRRLAHDEEGGLNEWCRPLWTGEVGGGGHNGVGPNRARWCRGGRGEGIRRWGVPRSRVGEGLWHPTLKVGWLVLTRILMSCQHRSIGA